MKLIMLIFALTLLGCVSAVDPLDLNAVQSAVKVERDDFRKFTRYSGPRIRAEKGGHVYMSSLEYVSRDSGESDYRIVLEDHYNGEHQGTYKEIYDSSGAALALVNSESTSKFCQSNGSCSMRSEIITAGVTLQYLLDQNQSGISLQISRESGSQIYFIPEEYIAAFLQSIDIAY